jgi:hypothetical protein
MGPMPCYILPKITATISVVEVQKQKKYTANRITPEEAAKVKTV